MKNNYAGHSKQQLAVRKNVLAAQASVVLVITSLSVHAATPEAPSAQTESSDTTLRGPGAIVQKPQAVTPSLQQEFTGIPWGSFLVFPEVTLSATYDDNIYAERGDFTNRRYPVEDVVYTLSPSVAVKSKWQKHALNFDVGADTDHYQDHTDENVADYWAGFDGRYDLGPVSNLFGGARVSRDHEDRSAPGAYTATQQVNPTLFDHTEAHLGIATGAGQWRVRAGGTYDKYDYKNGESNSGATVDQDFRDRTMNSLGVRLSYLISPSYELFGQYASDTRNYYSNIPGLNFNRDSQGYRAALGMHLKFPRKEVRGEFFAGTMKQNFDYSGFADVSAPYYGALVNWRPTPITTVNGFIDRSLEETTVFDGGTYASSSIDTTYGFEAEHKLTSKLSLNGRAAYTRSVFQGLDRLDTVIDAGAGMRYYVTPTVFLGADLRLIDRNSNVSDAQYSRNQLMFNVGYTPARNKTYSIFSDGEPSEATGGQGRYSGFYIGGQVGHGGLVTETYGPRSGGGSDEGDMGAFGESYTLFTGWGMEINNWYLGLDLDAGDSNSRWNHSKNKPDSVTTYVEKNESYGVSARVGYRLDGGLLFGRVGKVRTDFHTYYTENQYSSTGAYDMNQWETGNRWGVGVEIPASQNLFVRMGYSYTKYPSYNVPYQSSDSGATTAEQFDIKENVFNVGLGWRFGGERTPVAKRSPTELRGFYLGGSLGHGTLGTKLTGTQMDTNSVPPPTYLGPYDFYGDFANSGATGGFFGGYGYTFNRIYAGVEVEAEAANFGWYHERDVGGGGGRDFAVEKRGGYGGALRLGYVLGNGSLLYGRIGEVRTRFNTTYNKGSSSTYWVDRSDSLTGTRFGIGAEMPASRSSFVRMDYTYTKYDSYNIVTGQGGGANSDSMTFNNSENLFHVGFGFRF